MSCFLTYQEVELFNLEPRLKTSEMGHEVKLNCESSVMIYAQRPFLRCKLIPKIEHSGTDRTMSMKVAGLFLFTRNHV